MPILQVDAGVSASTKEPLAGAVACEHRKAGDGVCDWCATGLFSSEWFIMIPEFGYNKIHIFEPVRKS